MAPACRSSSPQLAGSGGAAGGPASTGGAGPIATGGAESAGGSAGGGNTGGMGGAGGRATGTGGVSVGLQWVSLGASVGARMTAIAIDDAGAIFVGGADDPRLTDRPWHGVFKSIDDAVSWHPASVGLSQLRIDRLVATDTALFAGGTAVFRSVDHGASWTEVTPALLVSSKLALGGQGNLVVAGADLGTDLFYSQDGGQTFGPPVPMDRVGELVVLGSAVLLTNEAGLHRSTDGGKTWPLVIETYAGVYPPLRCDGVRTCYANRPSPASPVQHDLMKSTDAGATWSSLAPRDGPVIALSDSGSLYVQSILTLGRSDDGGATFEAVPKPPCSSPTDPNGEAFAARGDKVFAACADGVYASTDKGRQWRKALGTRAAGAITGPSGLTFVDATGLALGANGDLYTAVITDAAGTQALMRSADEGRSWQMVTKPFSARSCLVTGGGALVCLMLDAATVTTRVLRSQDHGVTWTEVITSTTSSENFTSIAGRGETVYALGGSGLQRSRDDGLTFEFIYPTLAGRPLQVLHNGHVLIGTSGTIGSYRSENDGLTFVRLPSPFPVPLLEDETGRLVYVDSTGAVLASTDEGSTWSAIAGAALPASTPANPGPIAMDSRGQLFVVIPGLAPNGKDFGRATVVYTSTDRGMTWAPLAAPIPNGDGVTLVIDKQGRLVASTGSGIYRLQGTSETGIPAEP